MGGRRRNIDLHDSAKWNWEGGGYTNRCGGGAATAAAAAAAAAVDICPNVGFVCCILLFLVAVCVLVPVYLCMHVSVKSHVPPVEPPVESPVEPPVGPSVVDDEALANIRLLTKNYSFVVFT